MTDTNKKPVARRSASHLGSSLLRQCCPRCGQGKLFHNWTETHKHCPVCHLLIEREPGYFVGAMYFSYALAIVFLGTFMFLYHLLLPDWNLSWIATLATLTFVPFVPMVYRYSRVIWVYFDQWAWPELRDQHGGSSLPK